MASSRVRDNEMEDPAKRMNALRKRAEKGDEKAMKELRPLLKDDPGVLSFYGKLAESAQESLIRNMIGSNLVFRAGVHRRLSEMRVQLSGDSPTPLEDLLIERILTCWLEINYYDALHAQNMKDVGTKAGEYLQRRQDRAHRRFLSAVKMLAVIRRLQLPVIQVNIGEKQVNVAGSPDMIQSSTRGLLPSDKKCLTPE